MRAVVGCPVGDGFCAEGISVGKSLGVWAGLADGWILIRVIVALGISITAEVGLDPKLLIMAPKNMKVT